MPKLKRPPLSVPSNLPPGSIPVETFLGEDGEQIIMLNGQPVSVLDNPDQLVSQSAKPSSSISHGKAATSTAPGTHGSKKAANIPAQPSAKVDIMQQKISGQQDKLKHSFSKVVSVGSSSKNGSPRKQGLTNKQASSSKRLQLEKSDFAPHNAFRNPKVLRHVATRAAIAEWTKYLSADNVGTILDSCARPVESFYKIVIALKAQYEEIDDDDATKDLQRSRSKIAEKLNTAIAAFKEQMLRIEDDLPLIETLHTVTVIESDDDDVAEVSSRVSKSSSTKSKPGFDGSKSPSRKLQKKDGLGERHRDLQPTKLASPVKKYKSSFVEKDEDKVSQVDHQLDGKEKDRREGSLAEVEQQEGISRRKTSTEERRASDIEPQEEPVDDSKSSTGSAEGEMIEDHENGSNFEKLKPSTDSSGLNLEKTTSDQECSNHGSVSSRDNSSVAEWKPKKNRNSPDRLKLTLKKENRIQPKSVEIPSGSSDEEMITDDLASKPGKEMEIGPAESAESVQNEPKKISQDEGEHTKPTEVDQTLASDTSDCEVDLLDIVSSRRSSSKGLKKKRMTDQGDGRVVDNIAEKTKDRDEDGGNSVSSSGIPDNLDTIRNDEDEDKMQICAASNADSSEDENIKSPSKQEGKKNASREEKEATSDDGSEERNVQSSRERPKVKDKKSEKAKVEDRDASDWEGCDRKEKREKKDGSKKTHQAEVKEESSASESSHAESRPKQLLPKSRHHRSEKEVEEECSDEHGSEEEEKLKQEMEKTEKAVTEKPKVKKKFKGVERPRTVKKNSDDSCDDVPLVKKVTVSKPKERKVKSFSDDESAEESNLKQEREKTETEATGNSSDAEVKEGSSDSESNSSKTRPKRDRSEMTHGKTKQEDEKISNEAGCSDEGSDWEKERKKSKVKKKYKGVERSRKAKNSSGESSDDVPLVKKVKVSRKKDRKRNSSSESEHEPISKKSLKLKKKQKSSSGANDESKSSSDNELLTSRSKKRQSKKENESKQKLPKYHRSYEQKAKEQSKERKLKGSRGSKEEMDSDSEFERELGKLAKVPKLASSSSKHGPERAKKTELQLNKSSKALFKIVISGPEPKLKITKLRKRDIKMLKQRIPAADGLDDTAMDEDTSGDTEAMADENEQDARMNDGDQPAGSEFESSQDSDRQEGRNDRVEKSKNKKEKQTEKKTRMQKIEDLSSDNSDDAGDNEDDELSKDGRGSDEPDEFISQLLADVKESLMPRGSNDSDSDSAASISKDNAKDSPAGDGDTSSDSDLGEIGKKDTSTLKKAKEGKPSKEEKAEKAEVDSSSDNDFDSDSNKEKRRRITDKLLTIPLSDSDDSVPPASKKTKNKKTVDSSSDESSLSDEDHSRSNKKQKRKTVSVSSDDDSDLSDDKRNEKKKGKKRKKESSSESGDSDYFKPDKKPKKKSRIKKMASSNDDTDGKDEEDSPTKQRKNIRRIIKDTNLSQDARDAGKAEEERRQRIAERQKRYNYQLEKTEELEDGSDLRVTELVLEKGTVEDEEDGDTDMEGSSDQEDKGKRTKKSKKKEKGKASKKEEVLIEVDKKLLKHLKPHQVHAVRFLWDNCVESLDRMKKEDGSGCILAHSMGLGKTLSVIAFIHTLMSNFEATGIRTCLILCPLNTVLNWQNEFGKWIDESEQFSLWELSSIKDNYARCDAMKDWQDQGGILIMGYEMYRNLTSLKTIKKPKLKKIISESLVSPGPDVVVCDEGHVLKNAASALSTAVNNVRTRRRIVLTGTPLQNNLVEYHCMVDFVKPKLLGTKKEFCNRFVNPITNGQSKDATAFDVKLMKKRAHVLHETLAGCVQRRDYSILKSALGEKHEYVIAIRLSDLQMQLYERYLAHVGRTEEETAGEKVRSAALFSDYQNLMRVWNHPYLLKLGEIRDENKMTLHEDSDFVTDESESDMASFIATSSEDDPQSSESDSSGSQKKKKKKEKKKDDKENTTKSKRGTRKSKRINNDDEDEEESIGNEEESKRSPIGAQKWWESYLNEESQFDISLGGKIFLLAEILRMCEAIGDKVLLFSQSLLSLDCIEDFLEHWDKHNHENTDQEPIAGTMGWTRDVDYFRMDGSTSAQARKSCSEVFNDRENHQARLFLISTRAGSLGTNLVGGNRVIIFDASWNPSHDLQSMFRVYRFGQTKPVYIYRFLAQGTMEQKIYDRQVTKQSLAHRVVDEQQIERHFTRADLQELYVFSPDRYDPDSAQETPVMPKDLLLADLLHEHTRVIAKYHEHDSLLEKQEGEDLTEDERKAAWQEYEDEKKHGSRRIAMTSMMHNRSAVPQQLTLEQQALWIRQQQIYQQCVAQEPPVATANDCMVLREQIKVVNPMLTPNQVEAYVADYRKAKEAERMDRIRKRYTASMQYIQQLSYRQQVQSGNTSNGRESAASGQASAAAQGSSNENSASTALRSLLTKPTQ